MHLAACFLHLHVLCSYTTLPTMLKLPFLNNGISLPTLLTIRSRQFLFKDIPDISRYEVKGPIWSELVWGINAEKQNCVLQYLLEKILYLLSYDYAYGVRMIKIRSIMGKGACPVGKKNQWPNLSIKIENYPNHTIPHFPLRLHVRPWSTLTPMAHCQFWQCLLQ